MATNKWKGWTAFGVVAAVVFTLGNMFHPTVVMGKSMYPTLHPGGLIWVDRTYYLTHQPQRGEVIVFKEGDETYVKRIYRAPGESVEYVSSDNEWLGPIREDRAQGLRAMYRKLRSSLQVREMRVPQDSVFVLGDNYLCSVDSRQLGPIPIRNIIGRAHLSVDQTLAERWEYTPRVRRRSAPATSVMNHPAVMSHPSVRPGLREMASGS